MPQFREGSLCVCFFKFFIHNTQPQCLTKGKTNATDLTTDLVVNGHQLVMPGSPFTMINYVFIVSKANSLGPEQGTCGPVQGTLYPCVQ